MSPEFNIEDIGSTPFVGKTDFQLIANSRRSVFINGLDFMILIIMDLKLSMLHENNRRILLVRFVKYFVSQTFYNPPIKAIKYARNKKAQVEKWQ